LLERSIVALRVVKEAICIFGECTDIQNILYFLRMNASKHYLKRRKGKRVSRLKKHEELKRKPRMI